MTSDSKDAKTASTDSRTTPSTEEFKTPLGLVPERNGSRKKKILTGLAALLFLGLVIGLSVGLTRNMGNEEDAASQKLVDEQKDPGVTNSTNSTVDDSHSDTDEDWCGEGHIGNGICPSGHCCSYFGYCGFQPYSCVNGQTVAPDILRTDRFCGDGYPGNGTCANSTECCSEGGKCEATYYACGYWPDNRTRGPPCGNGDLGDFICEDESECCSKWGYCGTSDDHCNNPPGSRRLRATNTTPILDN